MRLLMRLSRARLPVVTAAAARTPSIPRYQLLNSSTAPKTLEGISTIMLDCDGVLWRGNDVVPNTAQALQALRDAGKRLLFVTNNSSKSRAAYVGKFHSLGIAAASHEVVSSSYGAAAYLASVGFNKKVFLVGQQGVEDELRAHGIDFVGGCSFNAACMDNIDAMLGLEVDPDIGAVVVGWDPDFSYSKLVYASVCLRELPGCLFVVTNTDAADKIGNGGRMMPGTGGLAAAVQIGSGVDPVVVGKEGPWLLPYLCQCYGVQPSEAAIVGDRLDTDIALGKAGGLRTYLPLTGVTTVHDLQAADAAVLPDYVLPALPVLAGLPA